MFQNLGKHWLKRIVVQCSAIVFLSSCQSVATSEEAYQGPFFDDKETVADVQRALSKYGYWFVPDDGILGNGTKRAITKFRTDAALPVGDKMNEQLLEALGLLDFERFPEGIILVVDR